MHPLFNMPSIVYSCILLRWCTCIVHVHVLYCTCILSFNIVFALCETCTLIKSPFFHMHRISLSSTLRMRPSPRTQCTVRWAEPRSVPPSWTITILSISSTEWQRAYKGHFCHYDILVGCEWILVGYHAEHEKLYVELL